MSKLVFALFCLLVAIPISLAQASYDIIVNEQGESLVLIAIEQAGTYQIPLQDDVSEVNVKGALYLIENATLEVSIGSTKQAAILFKTSALTKKDQNEWSFSIDPIKDTQKITLNLPKEAIVSTTEPKVLIDDQEYKKVVWVQPNTKVSVTYSFSSTNTLPEIEQFKENKSPLAIPIIIGFGILAVAMVLVYFYTKSKKANEKQSKRITSSKENKDSTDFELKNENNETADVQLNNEQINEKSSGSNPEAKRNIIRTLSPNEALIVTTIMDNDNSIKRNDLERKTKLAKSSLASSLHNLEQKNILTVDKTQTVHFVQLTEWFKEL